LLQFNAGNALTFYTAEMHALLTVDASTLQQLLLLLRFNGGSALA
jgi:hypothetical protein